ncbi:hypothetical protein PGAL8A_00273400 [Plasmodium gallinaceum]|uniref:Plasmodium RESA N-terminal domain-containing protein n=1 Tax=Plasmodium gallinaceum TaxID=5849 RepID=A0A1J1GST2_PLAGA|nr:hypothetical protein PGAL8A_00273400 [Plasmodium gallinaceum]CRG95537.1 hypothetical protein PGAL8A_00273400 [Plasmodium gallinaceum]
MLLMFTFFLIMKKFKVLFFFSYLLIVNLLIPCLTSEPENYHNIPNVPLESNSHLVRTHSNSDSFVIPTKFVDLTYDLLHHILHIFYNSINVERQEMIKGIKSILHLVHNFLNSRKEELSKCSIRLMTKFTSNELRRIHNKTPAEKGIEKDCLKEHMNYWSKIKFDYNNMIEKMHQQWQSGGKSKNKSSKWKKVKWEEWHNYFHKYLIREGKRSRLDFVCMMQNGCNYTNVKYHYEKIISLWDEDMKSMWTKWNSFLDNALKN